MTRHEILVLYFQSLAINGNGNWLIDFEAMATFVESDSQDKILGEFLASYKSSIDAKSAQLDEKILEIQSSKDELTSISTKLVDSAQEYGTKL